MIQEVKKGTISPSENIERFFFILDEVNYARIRWKCVADHSLKCCLQKTLKSLWHFVFLASVLGRFYWFCWSQIAVHIRSYCSLLLADNGVTLLRISIKCFCRRVVTGDVSHSLVSWTSEICLLFARFPPQTTNFGNKTTC